MEKGDFIEQRKVLRPVISNLTEWAYRRGLSILLTGIILGAFCGFLWGFFLSVVLF